MTTIKIGSKTTKKGSAIPRDGKRGAGTKPISGSAILLIKTSKVLSTTQARSAAQILASPNSSKAAKKIAASVLSQKKQPFPVKTYKVAGSTLTQKSSATAVRKVAKKMAK